MRLQRRKESIFLFSKPIRASLHNVVVSKNAPYVLWLTSVGFEHFYKFWYYSQFNMCIGKRLRCTIYICTRLPTNGPIGLPNSDTIFLPPPPPPLSPHLKKLNFVTSHWDFRVLHLFSSKNEYILNIYTLVSWYSFISTSILHTKLYSAVSLIVIPFIFRVWKFCEIT